MLWFEYHSVDSRGEVIDVAKTQSESLNGTKSSILGAKLDKGCVCKNINGSARKGHTEFALQAILYQLQTFLF